MKIVRYDNNGDVEKEGAVSKFEVGFILDPMKPKPYDLCCDIRPEVGDYIVGGKDMSVRLSYVFGDGPCYATYIDDFNNHAN